MATALSELYEALRTKAGVLPVEETKGNGQVKFLARLQPDKLPNWKVVMQRLKKGEIDASWSIDISKVFFLKNNSANGVLVHGWRLIVKAVELDKALLDIAKLVKAAPNARVELEEVVLPGGGAHRNYATSGGKGATFTSGSRSSGPHR